MKRALPLPLLLLCLAAGPALAQRRPLPPVCKEGLSECREDCSSDYGGSTRLFKQLTACIEACNEKLSLCRDRHYTSLDSGLAPGALDRPREADPAAVEPSRRTRVRDERLEDLSEEEERPARASKDTRPAAPASEEESPALAGEPEPAPLRRDVYRAPTEAPPKKAEPAPALAQDDTEDDGLAPLVPPTAEVKPAALKESRPATAVADSGDDAEPLPPPPPPKPKVEPRPAEPLRPAPPPEPRKKDISEWDPDAEE